MSSWISLAAALGVTMANGVAAILQKEGADSQERATSINPKLVLRLLRDWRYVLGVLLDIIAGGLIVVAVHNLPLFLVQAIVACAVVITFIIECFILKRYRIQHAYRALGMVFAGLVLLGVSAVPESARHVSLQTDWGILLAILPIALLGMVFSRVKHPVSAVFLAILSGMAFGGVAVAGRVLDVPDPFWRLFENPAVYAYILFGGLGVTLFTVGLQRASATVFTTIMVTAETLVPASIGVFFLGDTVRPELWPVAISGLVITLVGALLIATAKQTHLKTSKRSV